MRTIEIDSAASPLMERAGEETVVLTLEGKPYAALVSFDEESAEALLKVIRAEEELEFDAEIEALSNHPKFLALVEQAMRSLSENGGTPAEEFHRELGF